MSGTPCRGARSTTMHLGVTPISATRACMQFALPEHEGADILGMALLWQHCIRTCVLGPLQTVAAVSAGTAQPCLTLSQLQKHWEDKVEAKILSQLGTTAGTDSSIKKGCGPLLVALVSALKSKLGGAAVRVPGDLLDAFSSASMLDWISRYSESVHTSNTATPYQTKFGKTSDFLARVVQLTVQEWTSVLREPAGQNNVTLAVSTSTSMDITLADFRKMTAVSGSKLVAFFYERLHPSAKLTGSVGNGHSSRVAREQELTNKQKTWSAKFDAWVTQTFMVRSGKHSKFPCSGGSSVSAAAAVASSSVAASEFATHKTRTCRWKSCLERDISSSSKYVVVRCNAGCISNMHPACFQLAVSESQKRSPSEVTCAAVGDASELGSVPCPRAYDKPCGNAISKAAMKQQHKVITFLIPVRGDNVDACASDSEDEVDTEGSEDNDDEDTSAESGVRAGRRRGARKGASLTGLKTSKLKRMRTLEDGTVIFDDELERLEHTAIKAEKKRLAEEKEKRKRDADNTKRSQPNPSSVAGCSSSMLPASSSAAAGSASETPKKKPVTFEVVVPYTQRAPTTNGGANENVVEECTPSKLPHPLVPAALVPAVPTAFSANKKEDIFTVDAALRTPNKTIVPNKVALHTPDRSSYAAAACAFGSTGGIIATASTASTGFNVQLKSNSTSRTQRQLRAEHETTELVLDFAGSKNKKTSRRQSRAAATAPASTDTDGCSGIEQPLLQQVDQAAKEQRVDEKSNSAEEQKLDWEYKVEQRLDSLFEQEFVSPSVAAERNSPCAEGDGSRSDTALSMDEIFSSRPSSKAASPGRDDDIILMQPRTISNATSQYSNLLRGDDMLLTCQDSDAKGSTICTPHISSPIVSTTTSLKSHTTSPSPATSSTSSAVKTTLRLPIPTVTMWQDVLASPGNAPSTVILLRSVPFGVTCQSLGPLFAHYGRVSVNMVYTVAHGLVATLKFDSVYTAATVINSLHGRDVHISELSREHSHTLSSRAPLPSRWRMDKMVFGLYPISAIPLPPVQLLSFGKPFVGCTPSASSPASSSFSSSSLSTLPYDDIQPAWVNTLLD